VSDEFTNNVAQKFPNTSNKEAIERPWDVTEPKLISPVKRSGPGCWRRERDEGVGQVAKEATG